MGDITYKVGDPVDRFIVDNVFTTDMPVDCPLTLTVIKDETVKWIDYHENSGNGSGYNWSLEW